VSTLLVSLTIDANVTSRVQEESHLSVGNISRISRVCRINRVSRISKVSRVSRVSRVNRKASYRESEALVECECLVVVDLTRCTCV
jgi:hypothetical protein